jgi:putative ABC transport system permease protein
MILLQALLVCAIGYSIGIAMTALFFVFTNMTLDLRGLFLPWQIMAGVGVTALGVTFAASLLSIRRVLVLEPAMVLRG